MNLVPIIRKKFIQVMAFLFLLSPLLSQSAEIVYEQVVGEATGLESGESIYKEVHCGIPNEMATDVFYQSSEGALIAHKMLNYQSGNTTPSFLQTNSMNLEKVKVIFDQKTLVMSMTARDGQDNSRQYQVAALGKTPIVIDAGFDVFIRENWQALVSGKAKYFQFPLVSRSRLISLRIKQSVCQYETSTDQCFALEPSNWLFRMLASPIELGYDKDLIRLNRYRGLSNINDANGDGLVVDIQYQYQEPSVACNFERPVEVEKI